MTPRLSLLSFLGGALALVLVGCDEQDVAALPSPREPTADTVGNFCGMYLGEHPGPKGQIFLADEDEPLWFPSVRDTIAYLMLPEREADAIAIYVNDMARATNWETPEPGTWVAATEAWYVVGSDRTGGMGLPEVVPFSEEAAADEFAARHGGHVMRLADVPPEEIFELGAADTGRTHPAGS
ncbi:MAG: nitrous oxide reductase accessory protein NosL [Alphaproteobacteria bacterium]